MMLMGNMFGGDKDSEFGNFSEMFDLDFDSDDETDDKNTDEAAADDIITLAEAEGLTAHANAIRKRVGK